MATRSQPARSCKRKAEAEALEEGEKPEIPSDAVKGWKAMWKDGRTFCGLSYPGLSSVTVYERNKVTRSSTAHPLYFCSTRGGAGSWGGILGLPYVCEVYAWGNVVQSQDYNGKCHADVIMRVGELLPIRVPGAITGVLVARALASSLEDVKDIAERHEFYQEQFNYGLSMFLTSEKNMLDLEALNRTKFLVSHYKINTIHLCLPSPVWLLASPAIEQWLVFFSEMGGFVDANGSSFTHEFKCLLGEAIKRDNRRLVKLLLGLISYSLCMKLRLDYFDCQLDYYSHWHPILDVASVDMLSALANPLTITRAMVEERVDSRLRGLETSAKECQQTIAKLRSDMAKLDGASDRELCKKNIAWYEKKALNVDALIAKYKQFRERASKWR